MSLDIITVNSMLEVKNAVAEERGIILIQGREFVNECVSYLNKKKMAKIAGNVGIVAGLIFAWPLAVVGVGQKIVDSKIKKYTYMTATNMNACFVIHNRYLIDIFENTFLELEKNVKKYNQDYKTIAEATGLKKSDVKEVFKKGGDYSSRDRNGRIIIEYINKVAGENISYPLTELYDIYEQNDME